MEKYNIQEKIGDGTYGVVLKALNKKTNQYVAIKKMKKKYNNWDECIYLKEVKALVGLKHPNIITLNEINLTNENELNLIFEFIGTNLFEYSIKQNKELRENEIRNIIFQILQGLVHMHKNNFFHRDMKPENILIDGENVKIADFGLAKEIKSRPPHTDYVATRWYRSPEVILKGKNYNSPVDIFAVGAIMAELYNNKPLFPGKSEFEQMTKICEVLGTPNQSEWADGHFLASKVNYKFPISKGQKLSSIIPRASENAINLLTLMLDFNPSKRPTAAQCLQHSFFQCYDILSLYGLRQNQIQGYANSSNNNTESSNNSLTGTIFNKSSSINLNSNTNPINKPSSGNVINFMTGANNSNFNLVNVSGSSSSYGGISVAPIKINSGTISKVVDSSKKKNSQIFSLSTLSNLNIKKN